MYSGSVCLGNHFEFDTSLSPKLKSILMTASNLVESHG